MYHTVNKLMYTVNLDNADPRFGNMLLEQFGGVNGELAAAMQYSIQGLNCDDPEPQLIMLTASSSKTILVTTLDLTHNAISMVDSESEEAPSEEAPPQ